MPAGDRVHRVASAQQRHASGLLSKVNVLGVGTGYRVQSGRETPELCVQVFVRRKLPPSTLAPADMVATTVEGAEGEAVGTDVVEIGVLEAYQDTTRYRPVPGGCSIGPEWSTTAGTLGGWAWDREDDTLVLVTNNHIIANLDTPPEARGIVQPGRFDGGTVPADVIGELKREIRLSTVSNAPGAVAPVSLADAAIGTIAESRTDTVLDIAPAIYEIGEPALGMRVQKRGRTTGLTTNGRVTSVNVTINLTYLAQTRLAQIANSFLITSTDGASFSGTGDSGSLIFGLDAGAVDGTLPVVGLLYGGSVGGGGAVTIANDIHAVFEALNLRVLPRDLPAAVAQAFRPAHGAATPSADGRSLGGRG